MTRSGWSLLLLCLGCPPEIVQPPGGGGQGGDGGAPGGGGGEAPLDCAALEDDCNTFALADGACVATPRGDGLPCDDGLGCTLLDHCQAGACVPGAPAECASPKVCLVAQCNEETNQCELAPANEGIACEDGDLCTTGTTCSGGVCSGGAPVECGGLAECSEQLCDPAIGCYAAPANIGLPCGGEPPQCQAYHCVASLGGYCAWYPVDDGQACEDPYACTINDACVDAECRGEYLPEGTPCTPAASCFVGGACSGSDCLPLGDTCGDSTEVCVSRVCDVSLDVCIGYTYEGDACEHPSVCRGAGNCYGGKCSANWVPENDGAPCDDAGVCMTAGTCAGGACVGQAVTSCAAGDGCCPAGCTELQDSDCGVRVYMASTQGLPGFFAYDPESGAWATLPEPPSPIRSRLAADEGMVYAIGEDLVLYRYEPQAGSWTVDQPIPAPALYPATLPEGYFLARFAGGALLAHPSNGNVMLREVGEEWVSLSSFLEVGTAGTFDRASGRYFLRHPSWAMVHALDAETGISTLWSWDGSVALANASRFGSYLDGAFFVVTQPAGSLLKLTEQSPGVGTPLSLTPADPNPSSDADPEAGLIYVGPSDAAAAFQALDPLSETLVDLPSPPPIPDGYLSSLAVARAPSAP